MNSKRSLATAAALALLLGTGLAAAVPGVGLQPATAQDQAQGTLGEQFFRVDFMAKPDGHGNARITGYVYNKDGRAADDVQLRITGLDSSGYAMASYVERVLETVPALGRAYFDVEVPGDAASYRVVVDSWNTVDGGSN